jgi:hypothetical protein
MRAGARDSLEVAASRETTNDRTSHGGRAPEEWALEDERGASRLPGCVSQWAWVLGDLRRIVRPVAYDRPSGAVTWVKLDKRKAAEVLAAKSVLVR